MHSLTMLAAAFLMSPDVYNRYLVRAYEAFDRTPLFVQLAPGSRGELASGLTRPTESRLGPVNQVKSDDENKDMPVGGRNVTSVTPKRAGHSWQVSKVIRHNDKRRDASGDSSVGTTSSSMSPSGRGSGRATPEAQTGNETDPRVVRESSDRASVVRSGGPSPSIQARELLLEQRAILIRHGVANSDLIIPQILGGAFRVSERPLIDLSDWDNAISFWQRRLPNVPTVRDRELSIEERRLYGQWEVPGLSRDLWGRDGINRYSILGTDSQRLLWETHSQRLRELHFELPRMSRTEFAREPQRYFDLISPHLELSRMSRTRSMPGRIVRGR